MPRHAPGLQFLSVDGRHAQNTLLFGLEHGHTLNPVQVDVLRPAAEQVHFQVGLGFRQCIILVRQFHAYIFDIVHRLFERGEETVQVVLIGIDTVPALMFWFQIQCPTVLVILDHLYLVETDFVRPFDRRRHVQCGKHFQCPVL